jgi:hypothetical protein
MKTTAEANEGVLAIAVALLAIASTLVVVRSPSVSAQDAPADAVVLLDRVAAADEAPYRARQLVVYFGKPQSAAILDVRSSSAGRFVRAESGKDVTRVWAQDDIDAVEGTDSNLRERAPLSMRLQPSAVRAKYEIEAEPKERLLGVELTPLTLSRRRDGALVERWWVHERSGVLYRRALYDDAGKVVGMSTVIDMEWGEPDPPDPVDDADVDAWVRAHPAPQAPQSLPGNYELWQTYELEVDGRPIEQWVYTDGLHALSVFRSEGNLKAPSGFTRSSRRVWTGPGPGTWAWEGAGGNWLMVAEEPALDAAELIEPFPRGGPTFGARLGSVWSRLFVAIGDIFS